MTKEKLIESIVTYIKKEAEIRGLNIEDKGTGHAFDGSFWSGTLTDTSNIPNIIAEKDGYSIELRSFWGLPEIDVRDADGMTLLVLNYSDYVLDPDNKDDKNAHKHTSDYKVSEVRADGFNYKDNINRIYKMIEDIERIGNGG